MVKKPSQQKHGKKTIAKSLHGIFQTKVKGDNHFTQRLYLFGVMPVGIFRYQFIMTDKKLLELLKYMRFKFDNLGTALVYFELTQFGPLSAPQLARNLGYSTARIKGFLQYLRYHRYAVEIKKGRINYYDAKEQQL